MFESEMLNNLKELNALFPSDVNLLLTGGAVRDKAKGVDSKDLDFCVIFDSQPCVETDCDSVTAALEDLLTSIGFECFDRTPSKLTVRAKVPESMQGKFAVNTFDFTCARRETSESDGRSPDAVFPVFGASAAEQDMLRRDFTVNAMFVDCASGQFFDLFDGLGDLDANVLRFVGDAEKRVQEDFLRVLRALRFSVCKGFTLDVFTWQACVSKVASEGLSSSVIPKDRIRDELNPMLKHDSIATMKLLVAAFAINPDLEQAIFKDGLHFEITNKKIKGKG